ncbi:PAS domain-containing protein [Actinomadura decatromicini]|uniref:PAS domain-containing protein n=1 Tax=Actinomadura decatromicini TaxID=2604572 RepID=UPI00165337C3|nr:PAS domain-containing protein [Actinomadura decatromicini]
MKDSFAVVVADTDGLIRSWDSGAETLFGHEADAVVGQSLDIIVPDEYKEAHWAAFKALMATPANNTETGLDRGAARLSVHCRDGSLRPLAVRLMLLRDPWGSPAGAVALFSAAEPPPEAEALPEL